ncbi:ComEA family DNA-binding protein [Brevibacillus massiliensis]|jgi:competence protein ComEA|uniref:ComEA family DNA-binding protein n=1 Tax=Brevibacillus massiliensis TaxID=1118054 RepID=UPI0002E431F4|nr:ComEA family DNA-binding protein [Brevibacillus massiliensis]
MLYDLWERHRRIIIVIGITLFVLVSFLFYPGWPNKDAPSLPLPAYAAAKASEDAPLPVEKKAESPPAPAVKYVDVKGSVKQPGVYTFSDNERTGQIIAKAGGFLPEADADCVNLAQPLTDGMVIFIPAKNARCGPCGTLGRTPGAAASGGPSAGQAASGGGDKVNLNTATQEQLMTLPGIGETRAQAILAYREQHGPFSSPEQLKKVSGIGNSTYDRLKDKIAAP